MRARPARYRCPRKVRAPAALAVEPTRVYTNEGRAVRDVRGFRATGATRTLDSRPSASSMSAADTRAPALRPEQARRRQLPACSKASPSGASRGTALQVPPLRCARPALSSLRSVSRRSLSDPSKSRSNSFTERPAGTLARSAYTCRRCRGWTFSTPESGRGAMAWPFWRSKPSRSRRLGGGVAVLWEVSALRERRPSLAIRERPSSTHREVPSKLPPLALWTWPVAVDTLIWPRFSSSR